MINASSRKKATLLFPALFLIAAPSLLLAQDPCSSLLTHGIYDSLRESGKTGSLSELRNEMCSAYQKYVQDKQAGSTSATYEVFSGSLSLSKEQIEATGQQMCDLNYSYATATSLQTRASAVISTAAVQAWQACVTQYGAGLRVSTDIAGDDTVLDMSVYYVPPPGVSTYPSVTDVIVSPASALTCQGGLLAAAQADASVSGQALQLTCTRAIATTPIVQSGRSYWALPVSLSVHTTAGIIVRRLSGVPVPPAPATPNVGDILASLLAPGPFASLHGPGWVLADGRSVPSTNYAALIGTNVPDLRGLFLRGINAGRTGTYADPVGERVPGAAQDDSTALPEAGFSTSAGGAHNHAGKHVGDGAGAHQPGASVGPAYASQPIIVDGNHTHVVVGGDPETRPRNAAVFYYVRVD